VTRALLIDTDPGIDDAVAIALALAVPDVEVIGISTVGGNTGLQHTTRNALRRFCWSRSARTHNESCFHEFFGFSSAKNSRI
jgi:inosine-uridine nucleoside N-ribohydrolase